jgi:hypothetical protein
LEKANLNAEIASKNGQRRVNSFIRIAFGYLSSKKSLRRKYGGGEKLGILKVLLEIGASLA